MNKWKLKRHWVFLFNKGGAWTNKVKKKYPALINRLALISMKTQHWYKYEFQKKRWTGDWTTFNDTYTYITIFYVTWPQFLHNPLSPILQRVWVNTPTDYLSFRYLSGLLVVYLLSFIVQIREVYYEDGDIWRNCDSISRVLGGIWLSWTRRI